MRGIVLAGVLALLAGNGAKAGEPGLPPIPDKPAAELFKDVPPPWRDYLIQAREAERIADPLQRCLAYPDIPGNQWPKGHARAHCLDHAVRAMGMADAQKLLDAGKLDELDAYVRRVEAEHVREVDASEEIHYFFNQFAAENADSFTAAWLKAAPENPYALTARGEFFSGRASDARGTKLVAKTLREDMREMTAFYDQAVPLYRKAVSIRADFLPAWIELFEIGYRDSRTEIGKEAFDAAGKIDPACLDFADSVMRALEPRWGGSYEAMLAYAKTLQPFLKTRPNLARMLAAPYGDRGDRLIAEKELNAEAMDVLDIAVRTASAEDYLDDGANVAFNRKDGKADEWKALAYLLQESRFKDAGLWANVNIARLFVRRDPAWALRYATLAAANEPEDAGAQFNLAASNYNTKRFDEAEKHYLLAVASQDYRYDSLENLVRMWMFDAGLSPKDGSTRAKPYLDRLILEYPDDGRARMYRIQSEGALTGRISDQIVEDFEKRVDPKDPAQVNFQKRFAEARKKPIMRLPPTKAK